MAINFKLVDSNWDQTFETALRGSNSNLQIICPFIKEKIAKQILAHEISEPFQVITRFNLQDFCNGVSDISALRLFLENGAHIHGIRNLHAKLYLFDSKFVILTSANLTKAALTRNQEFGFIADNNTIIDSCMKYFNTLWAHSGQDLTLSRLEEWEHKLNLHLAGGSRPTERGGLGDEGVDIGEISPQVNLDPLIYDSNQAFVKFFGIASDRTDRNLQIFDIVRDDGCHWACTYPKGKRPRKVLDGALMFMAQLVYDPNDILIFGRAVGIHHEPTRDDATEFDISQRSWKEKWPHYIRVHHAEFVEGNLSNGISLYKMMNILKEDSFKITQNNLLRQSGNTDPFQSYRQQPAVELSTRGRAWLNEQLELAFSNFGKITPAKMEELDWPEVPSFW